MTAGDSSTVPIHTADQISAKHGSERTPPTAAAVNPVMMTAEHLQKTSTLTVNPPTVRQL